MKGFGIINFLSGDKIECDITGFPLNYKGRLIIGKLITAKNEIYEGNILDGKLSGLGRYYKDGLLIYEGFFKGLVFILFIFLNIHRWVI